VVAPTSNGRSRVEMSGRSLYRGQMSMPLGSTTGAFPHRRCLQDRQRVFRNVVLVVCCKPQDAAPAESNALRLSCFAIPLSVILTGCSFQKSTSAVVSAPSTGRTATSNAGRSLAGQSHRGSGLCLPRNLPESSRPRGWFIQAEHKSVLTRG